MNKLNIDVNAIDVRGNPQDLTILKMQSDIRRAFEQNAVSGYASFSDLGIDNALATMSLVFSRLPNNTVFMAEIYRSVHVAFDMPKLQSGSTMSGRLTVYGSAESSNKQTAFFQNEYGLWSRHYNNAAVSGYVDSGWHKVFQYGLQEFLTSSSVTNLGGLMSNLKTPGRYYVNGSLMSSFTDTPPSGSGASMLDVEYLLDLGDTIQTLRTNGGAQSGWRRHISQTGTVGAWIQEFVSNSSLNSTAAINFAGGTIAGTVSSQNIQPRTTNSYNIGSASLTFSNGYFQNAITVVSDRNEKDDISSIPDMVLDIWEKINYSQWKMKSAKALKGDEARFHTGIIAQDIRDAFENAGLNATDYGMLIYEKWDSIEATDYQAAVYDESGNMITDEVQAVEGRDAGEIWMVRMEECLALEAALMRREIQKLKAKQ